ncbi:MAG: hypothetical protein LC650_02290 [Actinobacteria bacterium]|nr:hypothetical protein [Actinomycetota bacterium]
MIQFKDNTYAFTDGSGYWTILEKRVRLTHMEVPYINDEQDFGELCVYFDTDTWEVEADGLIYTDEFFLTGLRNRLVMNFGFTRAAADDVDYSEQGMQGDTYVSLDVGRAFLAEWLEKDHITEA